MEVIRNEFGINSGDYPDRSAAWRFTKVATQQELGLWTNRWCRVTAGNRFDPAPVRQDLVFGGAVDT